MSTDKPKKPADTITVRNDSMTVKHLQEHLTTSHLQAALNPSEKPKPVPTEGSSRDKGSAPTSRPKEK
jgi:hypothetical protein